MDLTEEEGKHDTFRWAQFIPNICVIYIWFAGAWYIYEDAFLCCKIVFLHITAIYWWYIFVAVWFITFVMFGFWIVKLITWIWLLLGQRATHLRSSCSASIPHIPARWKPLGWAPKQDHLRWRYSTVIHLEQLVYLGMDGKIWTKERFEKKRT